MIPPFQAAAIPVLLEIIGLADRAAAGTCGPVEAERAALRASFESASAVCRGSSAEEWSLASYALAAVVDELLIVDISWSGQTWWENHAMEVELFGTRRRATEFFERADRAAALQSPNALQVFVGAVVIGFRGTYRERPELLDAWLRQKRQRIELSMDRPPLPSASSEILGAGPLTGHVRLLWGILTALLATAFLIISIWAVLYLI